MAFELSRSSADWRVSRRGAISTSVQFTGGVFVMALCPGVAAAQHEHEAGRRQEQLQLTFPNQRVGARVLAKLLGTIESKAVYSVFRISLTPLKAQRPSAEVSFEAMVRSDWQAVDEGHRASSRIVMVPLETTVTPADGFRRSDIQDLLFGGRGVIGANKLFVRYPAAGAAPISNGIERVEWHAVGNSAWASLDMTPVGPISHLSLDATGELAHLSQHDLKTAPATFFLTGEAILSAGSARSRARLRGVGKKVMAGTEIPLSLERRVRAVDPTFFD
jgi:hypothetical protein